VTFPTTSLLDNFNRANGVIGAPNWAQPVYDAETSRIEITSNQIFGDAAGATSRSHAYWSPATFGPDSEAYLTIPTVDTQVRTIGLFLRLQTPGSAAADGYDLEYLLSSGTWQINRIDNGAFTALGSSAVSTLIAGDKMGFEAIGNKLTGYRITAGGWTSIVTATEATYPSAGNIGVRFDASLARGDDFSGGTVVSPAFVPHRMPLGV
jgi:hypothetical protein